jgi:hypothetical protein
MTKLRRLVIAVAAAATVAVGSHAAAPQASAMPMSCSVRYALARGYVSLGYAAYAVGDYQAMQYYFGRADGISEGCY